MMGLSSLEEEIEEKRREKSSKMCIFLALMI